MPQVLIGGGNHAHVDTGRAGTSDGLKLAFLQYSQQFGLQFQHHAADLIEQQGSLICGCLDRWMRPHAT